MSQRLLLAAVILPIVGLLALIGRAELHLRNGERWELKISGYDPRDMLSGHYLSYQYEFDRDRKDDTCGSSEEIDAACCLCLTPRAGTREPHVQSVLCNAVDRCPSWVDARDVVGAQRYFIPAERATEIEAALRERKPSLRVSVTGDGTLAVDTLLLDGVPWQELLPPKS